MLDERLLDTPSVAIDRSRIVATHMAAVAVGSLKKSISLLDSYDEKIADSVREEEGMVDTYEDALGSYLVKLSAKDMDELDSVEVTKLLHMIGDFERISDHSVNIVESAEEIRDKQVSFSAQATKEIATMKAAVNEILTMTYDALEHGNIELALAVEPLEQVVDYLRDQIKLNHTIRLQKNLCSIELGFILSDILTNLERVSDHCSNIAGCIIEMSRHETLDIHSYTHEAHKGSEAYNKRHQAFMDKYSLASAE